MFDKHDYNIAVIQWITLCHKNYMTIHEITLAHICNVTDNDSLNKAFHIKITFILKAIKFNFKESNDKQNLTQKVIS